MLRILGLSWALPNFERKKATKTNIETKVFQISGIEKMKDNLTRGDPKHTVGSQ